MLKKRDVGVVAIITILAVGVAFALASFGGREANRVWFRGPDLLEVDASGEKIARAIQGLHDQIADVEIKQDGRRSSPTFSQSSKTWKLGDAATSKQLFLIRSTTQFRDAEGELVRIERIGRQGQPELVFLEYGGEGGPLSITNALLAELQKEGVETR